jgi:hypothetical protein
LKPPRLSVPLPHGRKGTFSPSRPPYQPTRLGPMTTAAITTGSRTRRRLLVVLGVAVAGVGIVLSILLTQDTNQGVPVATQLASVQSGCSQWLDANPGEPGTGQWCSEMASWMSHYMDRSGVGPQMMWGSSDQILSTCEQWMTTSPPSGTTTVPKSWCSSMASWMSNHVGSWTGQNSWGGWMSHSPMMRGLGR